MDNLWRKETRQPRSCLSICSPRIFVRESRDKYVNIFSTFNDPFYDKVDNMRRNYRSRKDNKVAAEWLSKGNTYVDLRDWYEALNCFDKSLCFAKVGSVHVAHAYVNRSTCLFHGRRYKEALVDIQNAENANVPDHLVPTLEQRMNDSLKEIELGRDVCIGEFIPKLSYDADENFPCLANVVDMKYNAIDGHHLVAKRDIPVGKIISVETDFPAVSERPNTCSGCLRKKHSNYIACPNCPDAIFCSFDCTNNRTHKLVCGTFYPNLVMMTKFVIKTILFAVEKFPNVDDLMQFVEDCLLEDHESLPTSMNMYHHFFKLRPNSLDDYDLTNAHTIYRVMMSLPKISALFDSNRKKRFLMHLCMHHLRIGQKFAGQFRYCYFMPIFQCYVINTKCVSNVFCFHSNGFAYCVVARPIRKGEPLLCNLRDDDDNDDSSDDGPISGRKRVINFDLGFVCKCQERAPKIAPIDPELFRTDPCYKYLVENCTDTDANDMSEVDSAIVQEKCIEFLTKYGRSPCSKEMIFASNVYHQHLARIKDM